MLKAHIQSWDARKDLVVPGDRDDTLEFMVNYIRDISQGAIKDHGFFSIALSGGNTPLPLYKKMLERKEDFDWKNFKIFWSDERVVDPKSTESNYFQAMKACFSHVPLIETNVFKMPQENDLMQGIKDYEQTMRLHLGKNLFDLLLLGVGQDGHIASLFPKSPALKEENALVTLNIYQEKKRVTLTFPCINQSQNICLMCIGEKKADIIQKILLDKEDLPAQKVGSTITKALWVCDSKAAQHLFSQ